MILVELALQMGVHVLAVERAELADGAGEYHPGTDRRDAQVSHRRPRAHALNMDRKEPDL